MTTPGVQLPMQEPLTCDDARRVRDRAHAAVVPPLQV